jgi:hypothetical protein
MSDFQRLSEVGTSGQRRLLGSALGDAPSPAVRKRALLALGLGGAATAAANAASAASEISVATQSGVGMASSSIAAPALTAAASVAAAGATSIAAPGATSLAAPVASGVGMALKWLGVATVSFSLGLGGGYVVRDLLHAHRGAHPSSDGSGLSQDSRREPRGLAAAPQVFPLPVLAPSSGAQATLPLPPPRETSLGNVVGDPSRTTVGDVSPSPSGLTVREEIALVEKARESLRRGDPSGCLTSLDTRQRSVRGGVLHPEAAILRIEALRALGQRDLATREAVRFFNAYPDSPLLERIRDLLEQSEP